MVVYLFHAGMEYFCEAFSSFQVAEFGDTVFIVLRKRPLLFLHWYHHVTVLVYTWHAYKVGFLAVKLFPQKFLSSKTLVEDLCGNCFLVKLSLLLFPLCNVLKFKIYHIQWSFIYSTYMCAYEKSKKVVNYHQISWSCFFT